jgi:hypothetical protein
MSDTCCVVCGDRAVKATVHAGELLPFCGADCSATYCPSIQAHCGTPHIEARRDLQPRLREVMSDHVYRTLLFVLAWRDGSPDKKDLLEYLLENQDDIGRTFAVVFGAKAGEAAASLFREHIKGAVPVLEAAKAGRAQELARAVRAWRDNAAAIAAALEGLDAKAFSREALERDLNMHLDHTIAYASAAIKRDSPGLVQAFETARSHMETFANSLYYAVARRGR